MPKHNSVDPPPKLSAGGGLNLHPNFQKGGLDRTSTFREIEFFQGGCDFHIKNKLKSEIFNDKKS